MLEKKKAINIEFYGQQGYVKYVLSFIKLSDGKISEYNYEYEKFVCHTIFPWGGCRIRKEEINKNRKTLIASKQ